MKIFLIFSLFSFLSDGMKIDCEFKIQNWITIGHMYTCNIVGVDFCGNETHVTHAKGTHLPNYSNKNVSGVATGVETPLSDCSKFHLDIIPKGFAKVFKNLTGLRLDDCGIREIVAEDLVEYPDLTRFDISRSQIKEVPAGFFDVTPNMRSISFDYNRIKSVGAGLLDKLAQLEYADFTENSCIDEKAETKEAVEELKQELTAQCTPATGKQ
jgi:hypothetical protein